MPHMDLSEDGSTYIDSSSDTKENLNSDSDDENKLLCLTKMGYSEAKASIAMERYGPDSSIAELTDFICAAQMAKAVDALLPITQRTLLEDAIGPLYLYNENVALAPVGVWIEMSRYKYVLDECQKWNLVWVGMNKVVPLEPDEVKMLLGLPKNYTRGRRSARDMFPGGINVLSLFSLVSVMQRLPSTVLAYL
ncbi:shaggy-related protein kinase epsilon [Hibiscus syriacus]|uniref:Shaggy-related protein kinase epsilon n=1 Tax=Hibiscus syriacus TaxID=106335 RepID=A0A6A3CRQ9_HIBSY|nr:shaggy-related protein kinase epsilon [Hibiscus syriacus]